MTSEIRAGTASTRIKNGHRVSVPAYIKTQFIDRSMLVNVNYIQTAVVITTSANERRIAADTYAYVVILYLYRLQNT